MVAGGRIFPERLGRMGALLMRYPRLAGLLMALAGLVCGWLTLHQLHHRERISLQGCIASPALFLGGLSILLLGQPNNRFHSIPFMAGLLSGAYVYLGMTGMVDLSPATIKLIMEKH
jgi:hypothetical protein